MRCPASWPSYHCVQCFFVLSPIVFANYSSGIMNYKANASSILHLEIMECCVLIVIRFLVVAHNCAASNQCADCRLCLSFRDVIFYQSVCKLLFTTRRSVFSSTILSSSMSLPMLHFNAWGDRLDFVRNWWTLVLLHVWFRTPLWSLYRDYTAEWADHQ